MIGALLYLQSRTIWNRTRVRLKRLKQPKYLLGALVGGLYFYFYFIRYLFGFGPQGRTSSLAAGPGNAAFYQSIGALFLFILVLVAWLVPRERAALVFTEAEVSFLFPAPISRRGLIHYKLLRSQLAILFTTLFLVLISNRFGGKVWIHAAGWWLALSTLNLHFLGASFAQTMLLDRGITTWRRRLAILLLLVIGAVVVVVWAKRTFPEFDLTQMKGPDDLVDYARLLLGSGPLPWLLYPFRLVLGPYFAPDGRAFLYAFGPVLILLALHYVWVVRSNVAFEEASVEASRKLAEKIAAMRAGNWQAQGQTLKVRKPPFALRSAGPAPVALLWKNLISAGQVFSLRFWIVIGIFSVCVVVSVGGAAARSGLVAVLGVLAATFIAWSLLLGPQFLRQDFRQDLAVADILKSYPLPGWQIALGELLAPAAVLAALQWLLIVVAMILLLQFPVPGFGHAGVVAVGLSAAVVLPVLDLITLQIPNAAVLLFPAWFQTGKDAPHGIEATGQRIILVLGQMLVFLLALVPAVVVWLSVFFLLKLVLGTMLVVPLASAVAAVVLSGEAVLGVMFLGKAFDRFDVTETAS